jgi:hypothetical protein
VGGWVGAKGGTEGARWRETYPFGTLRARLRGQSQPRRCRRRIRLRIHRRRSPRPIISLSFSLSLSLSLSLSTFLILNLLLPLPLPLPLPLSHLLAIQQGTGVCSSHVDLGPSFPFRPRPSSPLRHANSHPHPLTLRGVRGQDRSPSEFD